MTGSAGRALPGSEGLKFGGKLQTGPLIVAACMLLIALAGCEQKTAPAGASKETGPVAGTVNHPAQKMSAPPSGESKGGESAGARGESDNAALAAKVKSALRSDPELKNLGIDVTASGGTVTLFGTVDKPAQLKKAEQVASKIEGVKSVKNSLVMLSGS